MSVYTVFTSAPNPTLIANIGAKYPNGESLQFTPTIWFVSDKDVTAAQVCEKLGIGEGGIVGAVVTRIDSYFGNATNALWQWLRLKGVSP
ncbi:MAG: hypothetical protein ACREHE_05130 [Rhizomicrobium sp.]